MKHNQSSNEKTGKIAHHDHTPATTQTTCRCAVCGHLLPTATISNQGSSGDICPDCRAEIESCGCSD